MKNADVTVPAAVFLSTVISQARRLYQQTVRATSFLFRRCGILANLCRRSFVRLMECAVGVLPRPPAAARQRRVGGRGLAGCDVLSGKGLRRSPPTRQAFCRPGVGRSTASAKWWNGRHTTLRTSRLEGVGVRLSPWSLRMAPMVKRTIIPRFERGVPGSNPGRGTTDGVCGVVA